MHRYAYHAIDALLHAHAVIQIIALGIPVRGRTGALSLIKGPFYSLSFLLHVIGRCIFSSRVKNGIAQTIVCRRIDHQAPFEQLGQLSRQDGENLFLGFRLG